MEIACPSVHVQRNVNIPPPPSHHLMARPFIQVYFNSHRSGHGLSTPDGVQTSIEAGGDKMHP